MTKITCQIRDIYLQIKKKISERTTGYEAVDVWYPSKEDLSRYLSDEDLK